VQESADGDGGLRVTLRAADPDRIRRLVLRLGGAAQVIGPAQFAAEVRDTALAALAAYGPDAAA
jgi:proteasome accessory factor C